MATKEEVTEALIRFIREFRRYPTRQETRDYDYLYSQQTVNRVLGLQSELGLLELVYKENPVKCLHCGKPLEFSKRNSNKFCGHSCSARYTNRGRTVKYKPVKSPKQIKLQKVKPRKFKDASENIRCLHCQITLEKKQNKYCSLACSAKHRQAKQMDDWLKGIIKKVENRVLRVYLSKLEGSLCSVCGISEWNEKPIVLEVEHKDGNSEDDSRENVCLICPNCHSQTDTYKGKNKGKGRHSRMQRYYEGKSY